MARLLIIGDTHIPDRAYKIEPTLRDLIESEKPWDIVLFTGDLTSRDILNWVYSLGEKVLIVRGNMDYLPLPKHGIIEVDGLRVGLHHGDGIYPRGDTQKLASLARSMRVNILVTGHTHYDFVKLNDSMDILLLNPGSLTGVYGGGGGSLIPSLMVATLDHREAYITIFRYYNESIEKSTIRLMFNGERWLMT